MDLVSESNKVGYVLGEWKEEKSCTKHDVM